MQADIDLGNLEAMAQEARRRGTNVSVDWHTLLSLVVCIHDLQASVAKAEEAGDDYLLERLRDGIAGPGA